MAESSPWSRLGFSTNNSEKENKEILILRDQIIELTKQVAELSIRLERVERVEEGPVENVFAVADYKDFFAEEEITNDSDEEEKENSDIVRVKSGFTAPAPLQVEETVQEVVEPLGKSEDVDSEGAPIEKEFDGEVLDEEALSNFVEREAQEITDGIVEMVEKYIDENNAILNNQLKKKIYSDIPVNDKIKKAIKEKLASHPRIKSHKLDKFRTLYYKGEDADEEYAKAFGS